MQPPPSTAEKLPTRPATRLRDEATVSGDSVRPGQQHGALARAKGSRHFRFSLAEHKLVLAIGDLIFVNLALGLTLSFREQFSPEPVGLAPHLLWFLLISLIWLTIGLALDVYDLSRIARAVNSIWTAAGTMLLTSGVFLFIPYLTPVLPTRRQELLSLPLLGIAGLALWRWLYALAMRRTELRRRVLIVGAGWAGSTLLSVLGRGGDTGGRRGDHVCYDVLGFVDDDPAKQGTSVDGVGVLGTHRQLHQLSRELQPDEVIFAVTHSPSVPQSLLDALLLCRESGLAVTTMASVYEGLTGRVPVEHAGRTLEVVLPVDQSAFHRLYLLAKRVGDILAGLLGCLLLLVAAPLVWLANRLANPGQLWFIQERVGQGGAIFRVIKFRSMVMDAEKHTGAVWAKEDDDRIPPLGRFLRRARLDELPQFWNVLKGEMSLVGPRPERPEFVSRLAEQIPFYRARHAVKPGITGWAQVKYRYGASEEDALIKLQYDLYYIKRQSLFLDLVIALKTLEVVLGFKGR